MYKIKKYDYDKEKNYTEEINKAAERGDFAGAGQLERQRNQKIEGEGLSYPKTYNYIDIGTDIQSGMKNGMGASEMKGLLQERENKAENDSKLMQFADDDIQKQGWRYYYKALNGVGGNLENRPTYENKYKDKIDEMLDAVMNNEKFSYDAERDPLYQQYKKQYRREGDRAMRDTLASIGQSAGGMNSYAVSAAAQANNYYNSQLMDKIPELYEIAYDKYLNEQNAKRQDLSTILDMENNDYNRYFNDMQIFDADVQRANNMYNDFMAEKNNERADAREHALMWAQLGQMPEESVLKKAGYTPEQIQGLVDYYGSVLSDEALSRRINNEGAYLDNRYRGLQNEALERELGKLGGVYQPTENPKPTEEPKPGNDPKPGNNPEGDYSYIDKDSVMKLGLGALTKEELDRLADAGMIEFKEGPDGKFVVNKTKMLNRLV